MTRWIVCMGVAWITAAGVAGGWAEDAAIVPQSLVYYVTPQGDDGWSGRLAEPNADRSDGPFASLKRARQALRQADRSLPRSVVIGGGTYRLDATLVLGPEDSGGENAPVVWQAAAGQEVRLSGGAPVPPEAFQPVAEAATLARLDTVARGQVVQADLTPLQLGLSTAAPRRFRGPPPVPELFCNDQRMTLARWPNEGWTTIARILDAGSDPRNGDATSRPGVFEYAGQRPSRWNPESGVWLHGYWCFDWYDEVIPVRSIDTATRQITLAQPHLYSVRQGNPSPRRWRAINLLEELDQPGEYYIDPANQQLYFWPPTELKRARIVLATLGQPVVALRDTAYVTLRGFIVETSQGDGIQVSGGKRNRLQACQVRNIRQLGIRIDGGTQHAVEACDIHDTGTGGLVLAGGDRRTLTPAGHQALNNHIWRFSQHQLTYANAVMLEGVGNRVAHNLIHDAPHQAIGVSGNDHVFEYNVVHDVCLETDDCGAYYKGRNPSCRGNVVRYNFWHHIGSPMGHGNAAIYFDDGDGGDTVIGNVFYRCGDPGRGSFGTVFSHGGHDNLAENNVFIECKRALGSAPWNDQRWQAALDGGGGCFWQTRLLQEVDITQPPYTTRYPALIGFLKPRPGQPRVNRAARNLMVRCGEMKSGNWQVSEDDNWSTEEDPGFVDPSRGDFRLRPESKVFSRISGFQPLPLDKMGLYADPLRPTPPIEPWPEAKTE